MKTRKEKLTLDAAETIALQGLTFLAGDPKRLVRFLSLTGLTPQDLKGFGRDAGLQMALDRLHDTADPVVSGKALRKSLGL